MTRTIVVNTDVTIAISHKSAPIAIEIAADIHKLAAVLIPFT